MAAHHRAAATTQEPTATATPWYLSGGVSAANCVAAYAAKGAASAAASYDNLASAATNYNLIAVGAPGWSASAGWGVLGTANYFKTGIMPDTTSQAWTAIVRFTGCPSTSARGIFGIDGLAAKNFGIMRNGASAFTYVNRNAVNGTGVLTDGYLAVAGIYGYSDGNLDATIAVTGGSAGSSQMFLGCWSYNGNPQYGFGGYITSFAVYNSTLTQAQVQAIGAAMP
jgi:hypothetical protein